MGGVRVSSIDLDLSLSPGLLSGQRIGVSETSDDLISSVNPCLGDA